MGQITIRADDDLIFRVRSKAKESGRSMNEYIVVVLDAATNPASATTERERLRERLARAGLLVTDHPPYRGQATGPRAGGGGRSGGGARDAAHRDHSRRS